MYKLQPGDVVRFYEITRLLDEGQGGMSAVYEARMRPHRQVSNIPPRVALKIALPNYEDRLRSEADFMGRFSHTNVVRVFGIPGVENPAFVGRAKLKDRSEVAYMAMEFLTGGSLTDQVEQRGRLGLREATLVARDLALALQHIHSRRVINLDIKPDNVLFRGNGRRWLGMYPEAVLCDFGIARDVDYPYFGEHAATLVFAAPEQIQYGQVDPTRLTFATDIFQWGILVYLMVTGDLPFGGDGGALLDPSYPAPPVSSRRRVPKELDQMLQRALQKDPHRRYQTADELLRDMKQLRVPPVRQAVFFSAVGAGLLATALAAGKGVAPTDPHPVPTFTMRPPLTAPPTVPSAEVTSGAVVAPASAVITASATPTPTVQPSTTPARPPTSTPSS
ncbi:MAG: protein kinase [Anaerolineae bacterium]|nr:protein kinase [Anaerolineae bacterium]MCB0203860.1 protein kinase [Anaerolineae bacterium]